jgi:hypothetical protein
VGHKSEKSVHKFTVGQLVQFHPDRKDQGSAARGPYEVTKRLPHNGREYEYRIKSQYEEHERIAMESQLSSA